MGSAIVWSIQGALEETRFGRILLDVQKTLQALKTAGGGTNFFQPAAVEIATKSEREVSVYPTYLIIPGKARVRRRDHNKRLDVYFEFMVWGFGRTENSPEVTVVTGGRMARDIGRALEVDVGRGVAADGNRNAWDTELISADPEPGRFGPITFLEMRYRCPANIEQGEL